MTAKELAPFIVFVGLAFLTISAAVGAYVSSQRRDEKVRTRSRWIAASVWTLIAVVATGLFAIPVLDDFRVLAEPFREALLGTMVVWAIWFLSLGYRGEAHTARTAESQVLICPVLVHLVRLKFHWTRTRRTRDTRSGSIPSYEPNRPILLCMPGGAHFGGIPSSPLTIVMLIVLLFILSWVLFSQLGWLR